MSKAAKPRIAKTHRKDAERAAEHFLHHHYGCTHTVRAVNTKWQRQDLFACDVIGKHPIVDGGTVYAQVTCGRDEAVRSRRRKLEEIPWASDDIVLVLQMVSRDNPANARKTEFFFRVHRYWHRAARSWTVEEDAQPVPRAWFRAWKPEQEAKA